MLPAISPNLMKLSQFKGSTIKLKRRKLVSVLVISVGRWTTSPVSLGFHQGNRFKIGKCIRLSKGLHRYCYIVNKCMTQVSFNFIAGLSTNRDKYITVFLNFSIHPNI